MRKMAVELATGKDGKQGGGCGKKELPLPHPPAPERSSGVEGPGGRRRKTAKAGWTSGIRVW